LALVHRDLIITLAAWHKLPAVYVSRYSVAGGLQTRLVASVTEVINFAQTPLSQCA
jgi:hypothetical protein